MEASLAIRARDQRPILGVKAIKVGVQTCAQAPSRRTLAACGALEEKVKVRTSSCFLGLWGWITANP